MNEKKKLISLGIIPPNPIKRIRRADIALINKVCRFCEKKLDENSTSSFCEECGRKKLRQERYKYHWNKRFRDILKERGISYDKLR